MHPNVRKARPIGVDITLPIFPEAARHSDPRLADHQLANLAAHRFSIFIDNVRCHSREWPGKRARFHRCEHVAHENAARNLRAAGIIYDRQLSAPDILEQPHPRLRVPRFAGRSEFSQRRQIMSMHDLIAIAAQRANQRWRNTERCHFMSSDERPDTIRPWKIGGAIVKHHRRAQQQRAENFPRSHHPAHIGHPEKCFVRVKIKPVPHVLR